MKYCKFCGAELDDDAVVCSKCGKKIDEPTSTAPVEPERSSNKCGVAGFILSLIGGIFTLVGMLVYSPLMFVICIPFALSLIGTIVGKVKGQKIGLAVAGLVISGIQLLLAFVFVFGLGAILR